MEEALRIEMEQRERIVSEKNMERNQKAAYQRGNISTYIEVFPKQAMNEIPDDEIHQLLNREKVTWKPRELIGKQEVEIVSELVKKDGTDSKSKGDAKGIGYRIEIKSCVRKLLAIAMTILEAFANGMFDEQILRCMTYTSLGATSLANLAMLIYETWVTEGIQANNNHLCAYSTLFKIHRRAKPVKKREDDETQFVIMHTEMQEILLAIEATGCYVAEVYRDVTTVSKKWEDVFSRKLSTEDLPIITKYRTRNYSMEQMQEGGRYTITERESVAKAFEAELTKTIAQAAAEGYIVEDINKAWQTISKIRIGFCVMDNRSGQNIIREDKLYSKLSNDVGQIMEFINAGGDGEGFRIEQGVHQKMKVRARPSGRTSKADARKVQQLLYYKDFDDIGRINIEFGAKLCRKAWLKKVYGEQALSKEGLMDVAQVKDSNEWDELIRSWEYISGRWKEVCDRWERTIARHLYTGYAAEKVTAVTKKLYAWSDLAGTEQNEPGIALIQKSVEVAARQHKEGKTMTIPIVEMFLCMTLLAKAFGYEDWFMLEAATMLWEYWMDTDVHGEINRRLETQKGSPTMHSSLETTAASSRGVPIRMMRESGSTKSMLETLTQLYYAGFREFYTDNSHLKENSMKHMEALGTERMKCLTMTMDEASTYIMAALEDTRRKLVEEGKLELELRKIQENMHQTSGGAELLVINTECACNIATTALVLGFVTTVLAYKESLRQIPDGD
jgi:hypothetical protein